MRKGFTIVLSILLLASGVIICVVRWQAWFGMPAEPEWCGDPQVYTFPQWEQDTTPASLDILVLGDIHNSLTQADYDTLAARIPQVDAVAQVGDWMDRGQDYYYQWLLREWRNSALDSLPVIVCPGNHEYTKGLRKEVSFVWQNAFPHPDNGVPSVPGESYYIDLPSLRFIVLDTNPLNRLVYLTRTLTWLRQTMDSAEGRYIVVMMHHPVLSVAKGRANPQLYCAFRYTLGKADLVLAGHDHSYMRYNPFVVLNSSGRPKQQNIHFCPQVTDSVPVYGVISIDQSPITNHKSQMEFRVYRLADGVTIDSLYVDHH